MNSPKNLAVLYHGVLNLRMLLCSWQQSRPGVLQRHGTLLIQYFLHCSLHGWRSHSNRDRMFSLWSWNGLQKEINYINNLNQINQMKCSFHFYSNWLVIVMSLSTDQEIWKQFKNAEYIIHYQFNAIFPELISNKNYQ